MNEISLRYSQAEFKFTESVKAKFDFGDSTTTSTRRILIVRKTVMIMNSCSGRTVDVEHKFYIESNPFFFDGQSSSLKKIPIMNSTRD